MKKIQAGAGLPKFEQVLIKYLLIPFVKLFLSWNNSTLLLKKEIKKIERILLKVPKDKLQKRVVIKRTFGIEEHSSNYSINMTLEHLSIVTKAIIFVIDTLSKEQKIQQDIKIEAVKPILNDKDEDKKFFKIVQEYISFIESHNKIVSKATKKHPWFIEFNNKEWAVFVYIHTFVHRRQLEAIVKQLIK